MSKDKKNETSDNALLVETATIVRLMNERLFGKGEGGILGDIQTQHRELAKQMDANKTELLGKIDTVKTELSSNIDAKKTQTDGMIEDVRTAHNKLDKKVNWYSGGLALLGFLITYALAFIGIMHKVEPRVQ